MTPDPFQLFEEIATDRPVLVAVSGGSDSVALLLLAASWAQKHQVDLQVVTVDHGLRPEAAAEAAFVAGVSESLNLPHITLAWDGMKPSTGVSQAARYARYRLLEEFAADVGAGTILAGHTANDQAETILMRSRRGDGLSGGRGLAGMSPFTLLPEGTLLQRPLLGLTRQCLRDYLREMNQSWIEDPSNLDISYERVRIRQEISQDEEQVKRICRFGAATGGYRRALSKEAAELLAEYLEIDQGPVYHFDAQVLDSLAPPLRQLVLQVCIAVAGGAEYLVSTDLAMRVEALCEGDRMTAGNSVITRQGDSFSFYRETRNLPSILVAPGETAVWDGRLRIENNSRVSYFCAALTSEQLRNLEKAQNRKLDVKPRPVLASTPSLCADGNDLTLPLLKGFSVPENVALSTVVRAIEHYCPEHDLALLEFARILRGRIAALKSHQA